MTDDDDDDRLGPGSWIQQGISKRKLELQQQKQQQQADSLQQAGAGKLKNSKIETYWIAPRSGMCFPALLESFSRLLHTTVWGGFRRRSKTILCCSTTTCRRSRTMGRDGRFPENDKTVLHHNKSINLMPCCNQGDHLSCWEHGSFASEPILRIGKGKGILPHRTKVGMKGEAGAAVTEWDS